MSVASNHDYVVGVRDVLSIAVWGHTDLSRDYPVEVDGSISFPLIGRIQAGGLTTKEVAADLTTRLEKDYIVNPQVVVAVKEYLSKKVIILGEAEKPGVYRLTAVESSLLEVLSKAGGLAKSAGRQLVLVRPRRAGDGSANGYTILPLDLDRIQDKYQKGDPSDNIRLQDEDTIFIPKASSLFVLGEVKKTGAYALDRPMSAIDAIMLAEGFKETASQSGVKVLRRTTEGRQEAIPLDLADPQSRDRDFRLQSGDTIVVPKGNSFFVLGEVKSPGAFYLERETNVLEAIVRAGGFTDKASPGRTRVMRHTPKGRQVIQIDMNDVIKKGQREKAILIREDDVIIVPESFF
jgi:polysaccharide export outer membrane protein